MNTKVPIDHSAAKKHDSWRKWTVEACYGTNQISYQYVDQHVQYDHDQESIGVYEISKDKLRRLHQVYPFTKDSDQGFITVPNWAKELLYESMTLFKVNELLKFNNYGGDACSEEIHPFRNKISYFVIDDLTI